VLVELELLLKITSEEMSIVYILEVVEPLCHVIWQLLEAQLSICWSAKGVKCLVMELIPLLPLEEEVAAFMKEDMYRSV
jgi:hypothetical protein